MKLTFCNHKDVLFSICRFANQNGFFFQGLKNVGGNIRDTVMAKPKEFAYLLRHKFGSADNLTSVEQSETEPRYLNHFETYRTSIICRIFKHEHYFSYRKSNGASSLPRENSGPRYRIVF